MKLLKSAFWLGLAFIVIKPADLDLTATAEQANSIAMNTAQKVIINQLTSTKCETIQCSSGKVLTFATNLVANDNFDNEKDKPQATDKELTPIIIAPIPRERIKRNIS